MKRYLSYIFAFSIIITGLTSCRTAAPTYNYRELAKASIKLGIDIDMKDNHQLYVEVSKWLGVPYRWAGNSKRGVDCSGFTTQVYKKVYNKKLERSTDGQRNKDCRRIVKHNLKEGDLVFFTSQKSKRKVAHVGIYLKNNKFAHSSTRRGVIVSDLNENYYRQHWLSAGRVK